MFGVEVRMRMLTFTKFSLCIQNLIWDSPKQIDKRTQMPNGRIITENSFSSFNDDDDNNDADDFYS